VDYAVPVTAAKEAYLREARQAGLTLDDLNWGAPRDATLEFEPRWPPHVRDFVARLATSAPDVLVKFTRASHKLEDLAAIAPDAHFVHVVRDPRAVATSHIFRTQADVKARILREGTFFTATTGYDQWKSEQMAAHLVATRPEYAPFVHEPAFAKTMLVWKELYLATRDGARRHFPGRHSLVWHDELCRDPCGVLTALYAQWGWKPKAAVLDWARANVRPPKPWHDPENAAWDATLRRLELASLVAEAEREGVRG
jgi:hypothetical protein